jgi:hypothetical protein
MDEHPVIAIGLVGRPYPSFLLPGRHPTSVAYVLDVTPNDERRNKASIVLCCEDETRSRVISRRWELGPEWTAREGDTVGVGIIKDAVNPSMGGVYFTVNGRRIEMGSSVRLKRKAWERVTRRFKDGPDSVVIMENGGDQHFDDVKRGPSKLIIRVPHLAGGLEGLYPAVGSRGACQLLANTKGPHLYVSSGEPDMDCPPTYEE